MKRLSQAINLSQRITTTEASASGSLFPTKLAFVRKKFLSQRIFVGGERGHVTRWRFFVI